ncbi:MAG: penicillin-binding protein [Polyangiales bacterium]|nr:transpeptidase family protein [Myxococcales bacterium]MCB9657015.1 transpeptidase family protein [Sandaracinaceae bacterium]
MNNLPVERRRWLKVRIALLGLLLAGYAGRVLLRAYSVQIAEAPVIREHVQRLQTRNVRLSPKRGTIYDRHGAELAVSVDVDSVTANPRELRAAGRDPLATAQQLASVIPGLDVETVTERLRGDRAFAFIKRHVTPQQGAAVERLAIPGVRLEQEARRFYPNRELAAHVLGFANIDGEGIEGIELFMEDSLRGPEREFEAVRDRRGRVVYSDHLLDSTTQRGQDITLTIDKTIQHIAERELALAVQTFEARAGHVVVMDPNTGEILALANYPTFDPNAPGRFDVGARRNRAVTDRFEPGSTVKPFTVAGALAAGTIRANQVFDCGDGQMSVDEENTIRDSHRYTSLTPAQIIAFSSNIGTARIAATMGRSGLYRAMRRFGFGEQTGLPLPGETGGVLRHYRRWYEMDAATISFGQGMSVTSVQLATAMGAIANGGRLMRPTLVRRVHDADGALVDDNLPQVRRQVIPTATARLVADMMTAVTGPGGTGIEAAIDGYLVAGKTGTAQKADYVTGGYAEDQWLASFVGFVPAESPRLVISVVIDEPLIAHAGGIVAGPVFRRVGEATLRHLGVPPNGGGQALAEHAARLRQARREARIAAREAARAARDGSAVGAEARSEGDDVDGEEGVVAARNAYAGTPQPGPAVTRREPREDETLVPDVRGMSARAALITLHRAGLVPRFEGSGVVMTQEPAPGAFGTLGAAVRVVMQRPRFDVDEAIEGDDTGTVASAQGVAGVPAGRTP